MSSRLTRHLEWYPLQTARQQRMPQQSRAIAAPQNRAAPLDDDTIPQHDPPLTPREETVYLLHIAAEVEHALMVQYLYSAFSLGGPQTPAAEIDQASDWRRVIMGIAREEMGHLATVQNVLKLIGGPLTFEREDFPIPADLYPFDFTLEPFSHHSLAKYVIAEMPGENQLPPDMRDEIERIKIVARIANEKMPVNRVGRIYERVLQLVDGIRASDFIGDSIRLQVRADEWSLGYQSLLILSASNAHEAKAALNAIAEQGEGATAASACEEEHPSHFLRFLRIYRALPQDLGKRVRALPTNPTIEPLPLADPSKERERVSHPYSRLWVQLFNQRYRMLLMYLSHSFHSEAPPDQTPASPRGLLISWTFGEMYNLRSIAEILANLPRRGDGSNDRAGPNFEMPYSLALPVRESDCWRLHRDLLETAGTLIAKLQTEQRSEHQDYLAGLAAVDADAQTSILKLIKD